MNHGLTSAFSFGLNYRNRSAATFHLLSQARFRIFARPSPVGPIVYAMAATSLRSVAGATPRDRLMRLSDRTCGRLMRLPTATTEYTVTRGIRVPMRDGVDLIADHYAPTTSTPAASTGLDSSQSSSLLAVATDPDQNNKPSA